MKLKNSNCDKNSNNQIVTKLKNSKCNQTQNSNCDKAQIVTKLNTSRYDKIKIATILKKTKIVTKLFTNCDKT